VQRVLVNGTRGSSGDGLLDQTTGEAAEIGRWRRAVQVSKIAISLGLVSLQQDLIVDTVCAEQSLCPSAHARLLCWREVSQSNRPASAFKKEW
jgi:hypothetical protein